MNKLTILDGTTTIPKTNIPNYLGINNMCDITEKVSCIRIVVYSFVKMAYSINIPHIKRVQNRINSFRILSKKF